MPTRRTLPTLVASAALALGVVAPANAVLIPDPGPRPPGSAQSQRDTAPAPDTEAVPDGEAAVETRDVLSHLEALQSIAAVHGDSREAGTSGHEASARYVEQQLTAAGYEPSRQYFPYTYEEVLSTSLTYIVDLATVAAPHVPMAQSPGTPDDGLTGVLVAPSGAPTGCGAADWADTDATGAIALATRGSCTFAEKALAAADAGAAALIVHNTTAGTLNGTLGGRPDQHIPTIGVTEETGRALTGLPDGATLTLTIDKLIEERETFTVLAQTEATSDDSVVMMGAHLDGGADGPGMNDNGTGSAALLETALELAETGDQPRAVRFAWWGGSALGNGGSRHYIADLVAGDPAELQRIDAYIDVDTIGSPNHIIGVHGFTEVAGSILGEHLDSIGRAWVGIDPESDSDAQAFIERGVPSTGLSTGTSGSKSAREAELFGGRAGLPYDPNHDTVADDLDNVDVDVLRTTTRAVVHVATTLASRS